MQTMASVERRARESKEFAALLSEMLGALEHHREFDLGRLYETPYGDFQLLLGVLESWRLQRFRDDFFVEFREAAH